MIIYYTNEPLLSTPENSWFKNQEAFCALTDQQLRYLALMYDPFSPARMVEPGRRSSFILGCLKEPFAVSEKYVPVGVPDAVWANAIKLYRSLAPDEAMIQDSIESLDNYIRQVNEVRGRQFPIKIQPVDVALLKWIESLSRTNSVPLMYDEMNALRSRLSKPSPEPVTEILEMEAIFEREAAKAAALAAKEAEVEEESADRPKRGRPQKEILRVDEVKF
jgi:hypothetical protein